MKPEFEILARAGLVHPCCVPGRQRAEQLIQSRVASAQRPRVTSGSTTDMVKLDGGTFLMGTDYADGFPKDGEGPIREVTLDPFYMDVHPVTNEQFREFVEATGYQTEAERFGWSFVFKGQLPPELCGLATVAGLNWWCKVKATDWQHPEGPGSGIEVARTIRWCT